MSETAKENSYTHLTEEIEGVNRTYTLDLEIEREGKEVVTRCSVEVKVRGKVYHTDLDEIDRHNAYHPDEDFKLFLNDEDEEGLTIPNRDKKEMFNWAWANGY
tara:strand:- start:20 stop:328 length:309 start_codon:yes stop_codon:yes gene_type:complete